jgi:adenosylhomocysteinase
MNMILDDGGDLTNGFWSYTELPGIKGLSEENNRSSPFIQAYERTLLQCDSVTKSKFDNKYGCKESAVQFVVQLM